MNETKNVSKRKNTTGRNKFEIEFKKTNDDVDKDDDDDVDDCHYKTIQTHSKYELTTLSKTTY